MIHLKVAVSLDADLDAHFVVVLDVFGQIYDHLISLFHSEVFKGVLSIV